MNGTEVLKERYGLVTDRIREIRGERFGNEKLEKYFSFCADFLLLMKDTCSFLEQGGLQKASLEELKERNLCLSGYGGLLRDKGDRHYHSL